MELSFRLWKVSHGGRDLPKIAIASSLYRSRRRRWLAYSCRCQRVSGRSFSSLFFAVGEKERLEDRERGEKQRERERERRGKRSTESGRPADGWGVMSHRPVILKLPFNISAASVVTRKEVRGHTMIVEATTWLLGASCHDANCSRLVDSRGTAGRWNGGKLNNRRLEDITRRILSWSNAHSRCTGPVIGWQSSPLSYCPVYCPPLNLSKSLGFASSHRAFCLTELACSSAYTKLQYMKKLCKSTLYWEEPF